jgi:hypothetical protein
VARNHYTAGYKTKLVLEVMREERSLNEIASGSCFGPRLCQKSQKLLLIWSVQGGMTDLSE